MATPTFYWYDYETFGIHPALDRPAQFAGVRTDADLNPVGKELLIYNRLTDDYLPDPGASLVTGITPSEVQSRGLAERDFIEQIQHEISQPLTCNVGYNNIRFDDEFTRHTLFRNFFDPYEHEWRDGNSRWDLLDVVRLTRALRPAGIEWPFHPDGKASNRLEDLTAANAIEHTSAHDALSDVYATIAVAKLIKSAQPRLFDYAYHHRDKASVNAALNLREQQAVVHVSGMIPGEYGHTAIVAPIARHPNNNNGIIVLDLRHNPAELESLDVDEISRRVFQPRSALAPESRLSLKTIHANRAPVVVPLNTLSEEAAERLNINKVDSLRHLDILRSIPRFAEKTAAAMRSADFPDAADLDASLYAGGFFSDNDKRRFERLRVASAEKLKTLADCFDDDRGDEMLFRYRARNFPESLTTQETIRWKEHCKEQLSSPLPLIRSVGTSAGISYQERFQSAIAASDWPDDRSALRQDLLDHANTLERRL